MKLLGNQVIVREVDLIIEEATILHPISHSKEHSMNRKILLPIGRLSIDLVKISNLFKIH